MKVNQIVGEHKKGYRANIYRKKKVIAPQSTEIKPMEEDAKITKSDQQGVEITADSGIKTVLPADKATALAPDPQNPNEYDLNPAAVNPGSNGSTGPTPPKIGASVEMKTAEDGAEPEVENPNDTPQQIMDKAFETTPELKQFVVVDAEGDIDFSETFAKTADEFSNMIPQLVELFEQIVTMTEQWMASPGFATECDEPEKLAHDIADLKQQLATLKTQVPQLQGDMKQAAADLRSIPKGQAKQQMGAIKAPTDLQRIQELAGMPKEDISFNGVTQHDNGDMSYSQGPMTMRQSKDGSSDMSATIGDTTARVQQNPIGVKTITAKGPSADDIVGADASAQRMGVNPAKFAKFQQKESADLTAMLTIAGLR